RVQRGQPVKVHHLVLDPERVLEPLELRQAHVQRHLTALDPGRDLAAGLAALGAPTGGLAASAGLTAADAGLRGLRPRSRTQMVRLQWCVTHDHSTSSTVTRWVTVLTMPRISG